MGTGFRASPAWARGARHIMHQIIWCDEDRCGAQGLLQHFSVHANRMWYGIRTCGPPLGCIPCISARHLSPLNAKHKPNKHTAALLPSPPYSPLSPQSPRSVTHRAGMVTSSGPPLSASLRMRMRYCVILVSRCLFLCTRNLGQCCRCASSWSSA